MEGGVHRVWHWLKVIWCFQNSLDVTEIHVLGQSVWEWFKIIGGPLIIAFGGFIGGFFLNRYVKDRDDEERKNDKEVEEDRLKQDTLTNYFDLMTQLFRSEDWTKANETSEHNDLPIVAYVKARTFDVLNKLDSRRKGSLLIFLHNTKALNSFSTQYSQSSRTDLGPDGLDGADLSGADLSGADLSDIYLIGANLSGADLSGANLYKTKLIFTNLSGANLSGANLSRADLSGANVSGADLSGANLYEANLTDARHIKIEQIVDLAINYTQGHYSKDFRKQLGLPPAPSPDQSQEELE